jgi:glycolate oxidase FAD binding subunit
VIDDFGPLPLARPQSIPEVAELVRQAGNSRGAVYPVGGRTMLNYGLPPSKPGTAIDLRDIAKVIDYPARDMTVTVEAGITIAALQEVLAKENQRVPIDVPSPDRATLGGALAVNASGPRRYGFGTFRDYVIGISIINDRGQPVKSGGRVVKNVAGYDLCKLLVGSLGTLGIIAQVTLKLKPQPEERAFVIVGCAADKVETLLDLAQRTRTRPVCLELFNRAGTQWINHHLAGGFNERARVPESAWGLLVGFEDNRNTLLWQVEQIANELASEGFRALDTRVSTSSDPIWQALAELSGDSESTLIFKANLLPRVTAAVCRRADELFDGLLLRAHAGNGIVLGHAGPDLTLERAKQLVSSLLKWATKDNGNLVIHRCPAPWKEALPVWGAPRGDYHLMRSIKDKLDPQRIFNPGRFVDTL